MTSSKPASAPRIYRAYCITYSGERTDWPNLRRTQAVWREGWLTRNSRRLDLKEWGWGRVDD